MLAWADVALVRAGTPRTGRPAPVKGAWSGSAILKLPTAAGDVYFEAGYTRPPGEAALLAALSDGWPDAVPEVVAWDARRNLVLMRDFGGTELWGAPVPPWEEAVRRFERLAQVRRRQQRRPRLHVCVPHVPVQRRRCERHPPRRAARTHRLRVIRLAQVVQHARAAEEGVRHHRVGPVVEHEAVPPGVRFLDWHHPKVPVPEVLLHQRQRHAATGQPLYQPRQLRSRRLHLRHLLCR